MMPKVGQSIDGAYWTSKCGRVKFWLGNVTDVLQKMPPRSVHCVVTSPPYWGLRSYLEDGHEHKAFEIGSEPSPDCGTQGKAQCGRCFVCSLVAVARGLHHVLRDDGTLWLNLGDSYASGGRVGHGTRVGYKQQTNGGMNGVNDPNRVDAGLPDGNLVGVPWRVTLALQADGWILRQDIIWAKPSPMPESVKNRCTKAHEYVFLFAKRQGYYCDMEAIKDKALQPEGEPRQTGDQKYLALGHANGTLGTNQGAALSNKRSVWNVSSQGYPGAHFATFPPKLIEPMTKAGTSEKGCCAACGAPWKRAETISWNPTCSCEAKVVPCTVLDPFMGSGTTALVSLSLGRRCWGVDLSKRYLDDHAVSRVKVWCVNNGEHKAGRVDQVAVGEEI